MNWRLTLSALGLAGLALLAYLNDFASAPAAQPAITSTVQQATDDCTAIAQKAAMNLPEALPFQKLEKAARQARVMQNCMGDRAYKQNPLWLQHIQAMAQHKSDAEHISLSEAIETMGRESMYLLKTPANQPAYWVATP